MLGSDSDDDDVMSDVGVNKQEMKERGRLKKRRRDEVDDDVSMDSDAD